MALPLKRAEAPPPPSASEVSLEDVELHLLLEALRRAYDRDYGDLSHAVLRRRVAERMRAERCVTLSALQDRVLHDPAARERFVVAMSGGRRGLFREPGFFRAFRSHVIPLLQTYAFVRIWLPEVGSGEDAYAVATLLQDAGLLGRCVVYATALADETVARARLGAFEITSPSALAAAFVAAGIEHPSTDFLTVDGGVATFRDEIRENVMFSRHNIARDASINEFHAIVARGVVPLFNGEAQYRVHRILYESLGRLGFLCLGPSESLTGTVHEGAYRAVVEDQPIYRRMR